MLGLRDVFFATHEKDVGVVALSFSNWRLLLPNAFALE